MNVDDRLEAVMRRQGKDRLGHLPANDASGRGCVKTRSSKVGCGTMYSHRRYYEFRSAASRHPRNPRETVLRRFSKSEFSHSFGRKPPVTGWCSSRWRVRVSGYAITSHKAAVYEHQVASAEDRATAAVPFHRRLEDVEQFKAEVTK
jgi:hypothetical protein